MQKPLSLHKINDDLDSQSLPDSKRLPAVLIEVGNWAEYDISTLSFYQEVYKPVALHVSEQRFASELTFGE